jgi:hypothetical protein
MFIFCGVLERKLHNEILIVMLIKQMTVIVVYRPIYILSLIHFICCGGVVVYFRRRYENEQSHFVHESLLCVGMPLLKK